MSPFSVNYENWTAKEIFDFVEKMNEKQDEKGNGKTALKPATDSDLQRFLVDG